MLTLPASEWPLVSSSGPTLVMQGFISEGEIPFQWGGGGQEFIF
jgi:hypothetical protein